MLIGIQWKGYSQALVSVDGQSVGAPCNTPWQIEPC